MASSFAWRMLAAEPSFEVQATLMIAHGIIWGRFTKALAKRLGRGAAWTSDAKTRVGGRRRRSTRPAHGRRIARKGNRSDAAVGCALRSVGCAIRGVIRGRAIRRGRATPRSTADRARLFPRPWLLRQTWQKRFRERTAEMFKRSYDVEFPHADDLFEFTCLLPAILWVHFAGGLLCVPSLVWGSSAATVAMAAQGNLCAALGGNQNVTVPSRCAAWSGRVPEQLVGIRIRTDRVVGYRTGEAGWELSEVAKRAAAILGLEGRRGREKNPFGLVFWMGLHHLVSLTMIVPMNASAPPR